jgi:hypothetical protein
MPIKSITKKELVKVCAVCGKEETVQLAALVLGDKLEGSAPGHAENPHLVRMPPCSCGAGELVVRTFDKHPPELEHQPMGKLRKAVNGLALELRAQGRIHPAHVEHHKHEHPHVGAGQDKHDLHETVPFETGH